MYKWTNTVSFNVREILSELTVICVIKVKLVMATGQSRGLILIRRYFSWKVKMTVLQIVTTKHLNPDTPSFTKLSRTSTAIPRHKC